MPLGGLGASPVVPHDVVKAACLDVHLLGHSVEEGSRLVLVGLRDHVLDEAHDPFVGLTLPTLVSIRRYAQLTRPHP